MTINSRNKLQEWLDQNNWFEDGFISEIQELDKSISLKVGYQIKGTYVAGEEQEIIEFCIKSKNTQKWDYNSAKFQPSYQWCIQGIELSKNGLGLKFDTPYIFELTFDSIEIQEPIIIKTFTKPWISDNEIFITVNSKQLPTPRYWIDELKKKGFDVCFRYYGSDEVGYDKVPYPDYSGYFIQHKNLVKENGKGVFFSSVRQDEINNNIHISLNNKDEMTINLYDGIQKIISAWEIVQVNCGNVEFKDSEWKQFINENKFPRKIEELKERNVW